MNKSTWDKLVPISQRLLLKLRAPAAFLFAYCTWSIPRTLARLLSMLYVGQPPQGKPYLFCDKRGDAQVSRCIPDILTILPLPKLLLSLVTTVNFLQICEKLIQIGKMLFSRYVWLSNKTQHTDNPVPVPTQNRAQNYAEPA